MSGYKGIILAGGTGSRLHPITAAVNKHLLPVFDKPLIYYPLSTLLLAGVRDVAIVSAPKDLPSFDQLFGDGSHLGISITYVAQYQPRGIAHGIAECAAFIGDDPLMVILGDNLFHGSGFGASLERPPATATATAFAYQVADPSQYAVVNFGENGLPASLVEKPDNPTSHWAVPGLYFYPPGVAELAGAIPPGRRGEVEVTDLNNLYLEQGNLAIKRVSRGAMWTDVGTPERLFQATNFVEAFVQRQGRTFSCPEEIAFSKGWITRAQLLEAAEHASASAYGRYLFQMAHEPATGTRRSDAN